MITLSRNMVCEFLSILIYETTPFLIYHLEINFTQVKVPHYKLAVLKFTRFHSLNRESNSKY